MSGQRTSRQKDEIVHADEPKELVRYRDQLEALLSCLFGLCIRPITDFATQLAVLCCSTDPEAYFSKEMFRVKFGYGINQTRALQNWIVEHEREYAKNGKSIIAPLKVWFEAAQHVE